MSTRMTCLLAFALALPATGQAPAPVVATPVPEAVPETDLVTALSKELGCTLQQAEGAAGALLGLAKSRLKPEEFARVAAGVPDMARLLKAAPAADPRGAAAGGLASAAGNLGGLAGLAGSFSKLGLKPESALRAVPVLTGFVGQEGGAEAATLLAGALK